MSFLLDTNVVSELIKPNLPENVDRFLSDTDEDLLHISTITLAEIHFGIALMEAGRRKALFELWFDRGLPERFTGRILDVTLPVATEWGNLMALSRQMGTNLKPMDALLGATANAHGMTLVTRNTRDFAKLDLPVLNPWDEA